MGIESSSKDFATDIQENSPELTRGQKIAEGLQANDKLRVGVKGAVTAGLTICISPLAGLAGDPVNALVGVPIVAETVKNVSKTLGIPEGVMDQITPAFVKRLKEMYNLGLDATFDDACTLFGKAVDTGDKIGKSLWSSAKEASEEPLEIKSELNNDIIEPYDADHDPDGTEKPLYQF